MEKIRVYELAKELNTTSKRLMEKLKEIDINVKNHMSLLEPQEVEALFDHIGVIRHDKKGEGSEKPSQQTTSALKPEVKREALKEKNAPRIIRTTEIIINTKNESDNSQKKDDRNQGRNNIIIKSENTSGLRPGFIRDSGFGYKNLINKEAKQQKKKNIPKSEETTKKSETQDGDVVTQALGEQKDTIKVKTSNENVNAKTMITKPEQVLSTKTKTEYEKTFSTDESDKKTDAGLSAQNVQKLEEKPKTAENISADEKSLTDKDRTSKKQNKEPRPIKSKDEPEGSAFHGGKQSADRVRNINEDRIQQVRTQGDRLQGDESQNETHGKQPSKTGENRDSVLIFPRNLEILKPELTDVHKGELNSYKASKRDFFDKDLEKDTKREQRKETSRAAVLDKSNKKFKPQKLNLHEKKGISEVLSEDFILDEFYEDSHVRKTRKSQKVKNAKNENKNVPPKAVLTSITIPETITVKDLAESLKKTAAEVIKKFMAMGYMVTLNQEVDFDTAAIIADEFGVKAEKQVVVSEEDILFDDDVIDEEKDLVPRPPVVVVMGHVDHGKTSLLDAIRSTNVTSTEAGGITQHIGAYMVKINDRNITFLDTPGHEAFTAMRARGAQVTDIAVLVVAADDGVMPQTIEAINHAKAANVSIIVAINKIDKPGANPERVMQELTQHGLVPEEWGGDTICVPVSAKNKTNIEQLLEMILLTADMLELKANPNRQAKGTVIESKLDKDRGPIATVLVQRGTLRVGDSIVAGTTVGHVRAMIDDKGNRIKQAGPSTPVEILGLPEVPEAGETFYAITDEKVAKQLVEKRKQKLREQQLKSTARVTLDDLFNQIQEGKVKELNIIIKADVQGSVEAVKQSLEKLSNEEVRVRIIHGGVGAITESDVMLAQVSNAIIIGFNVRPAPSAAEAAANAGVDIRLYRVIYNAIEDIEAAMKGMLEPTFREVVQGHAEIRQIFKVSGVGTIGGCYVTDGKISRNSEVRVIRDGIVVFEGKLASLKRFKDDVREVNQGFECGLTIEKFNDIKEGDIIESFVMEQVSK